MKKTIAFSLIGFALFAVLIQDVQGQEKTSPGNLIVRAITEDEAIEEAIDWLLERQAQDGSWGGDEGNSGDWLLMSKKERKDHHYGNTLATTALAYQALLRMADLSERQVRKVLRRAEHYLMLELNEDVMKPKIYFNRIWSDCYGIFALADWYVREDDEERREQIQETLSLRVESLLSARFRDGGWHYVHVPRLTPGLFGGKPNPKKKVAGKSASFVTALALQALRAAQESGVNIEDEVFEKGIKRIQKLRRREGSYLYYGPFKMGSMTVGGTDVGIQGSLGRMPLCEMTLFGRDKAESSNVSNSIQQFLKYRKELDTVWMTGSHTGRFDNASYYCMFAWANAAEAARSLGEGGEALLKRVQTSALALRERHGNWQDSASTGRDYGTAMALLTFSDQRMYERARVEDPSTTKEFPRPKKRPKVERKPNKKGRRY